MVVEVRGKVVEVRVEESKMRMAVVDTRSLLPSSLLPSFLPFVPSRSSWLLFSSSYPCMRSMTRMAMSQSVEPRDRRFVKDSWPGEWGSEGGVRDMGEGGKVGEGVRTRESQP